MIRKLFSSEQRKDVRFTVEELLFLKRLVEEKRYEKDTVFSSDKRSKLISKIMRIIQAKIER